MRATPPAAGYFVAVSAVLALLLVGCASKSGAVSSASPPSAGLVEVKGRGAPVPVREQLLRTLTGAPAAPCYEAALARDPYAYGEVVVAFTVDAAGQVVEAGVHLATLGDAAAEACVVAAVQALRFPAVTADRLAVLYPFVFTSDATPPVVARALKVKYGLAPAEPEGDPTDPKAETPPGVVYLW